MPSRSGSLPVEDQGIGVRRTSEERGKRQIAARALLVMVRGALRSTRCDRSQRKPLALFVTGSARMSSQEVFGEQRGSAEIRGT